MTTPDDYERFLGNWEMYRDRCLKPKNHSIAAIAPQLWYFCPQNLQTILGSKGMDNISTETELLSKIKAVTIMMQNFQSRATT